jgi:hypothetical protein
VNGDPRLEGRASVWFHIRNFEKEDHRYAKWSRLSNSDGRLLLRHHNRVRTTIRESSQKGG